jgi:hypothetical protein
VTLCTQNEHPYAYQAKSTVSCCSQPSPGSSWGRGWRSTCRGSRCTPRGRASPSGPWAHHPAAKPCCWQALLLQLLLQALLLQLLLQVLRLLLLQMLLLLTMQVPLLLPPLQARLRCTPAAPVPAARSHQGAAGCLAHSQCSQRSRAGWGANPGCRTGMPVLWTPLQA